LEQAAEGNRNRGPRYDLSSPPEITMFRPVGSEYDPHGGKRRARAGLRLSRQRILLAVYEYTEAMQVRRDHNSDTS